MTKKVSVKEIAQNIIKFWPFTFKTYFMFKGVEKL